MPDEPKPDQIPQSVIDAIVRGEIVQPKVTADSMCHDLAMQVLREMEFRVPMVAPERKGALKQMIADPLYVIARTPQTLMHPEVLDPLMEMLASLDPPERYYVLCVLEEAALINA